MPAPCLKLDDEITLVLTEPDEYGTEIFSDSEIVKASIDLNTGYTHGSNQDAVNSDAICYISPENEFVEDNFYRLEEMLVMIDLFNTPDKQAWYKITKVNVARDTQLCNDIDHLELLLKKTAPLSEVVS